MAYPPITELPPAPQRGDTDFSEKANAHVAALTPWTADVNAAGAFIEQCVTAAAESRDGAAESATLSEQWATSTDVVEGGLKGARGYAQDAGGFAATVESLVNFKGNWADLTGALNVPSSAYHSGQYWQLLSDIADVALSEPGVSADWASTAVLQGNATGAIDMAGFAFTADSVQAERYDLASISTTATLDLATANEFTIDASVARTLTFANVPAAGRAMTVVLTISGASAITWPAGIRWHGDGTTAPELGATWTIVVLSWDGANWSGVLGASA